MNEEQIDSEVITEEKDVAEVVEDLQNIKSGTTQVQEKIAPDVMK